MVCWGPCDSEFSEFNKILWGRLCCLRMASLVLGIQLPPCVIQDFVFTFCCLKHGGLMKTGHRGNLTERTFMHWRISHAVTVDRMWQVPECWRPAGMCALACCLQSLSLRNACAGDSSNESTAWVLCTFFISGSEGAQVLVSLAAADFPQKKHVGKPGGGGGTCL